MTTKISNMEKILLVLKEMDDTVGTYDLALFTNINHKNIGRYLEKLVDKKYISRKTIQDGKKRYSMNKILTKGKNFKFTSTYDELKKHIYDTDIKPNIEKITENMDTEIRATTTATAVKDKIYPKDFDLREFIEVMYKNADITAKPQDQLVIDKRKTIKTEILTIIKLVAIRTQDAHNLGFKTHQQLTEHLISLILEL